MAEDVPSTQIDSVWREYVDQAIAVIDALADGVSDEMVHAFRRIEHEHCCLGAALDDVATRPVNDQERRALSAAIRAAKSREG